MSYPVESDRFFDRTTGWLVGAGACSASAGGDSRLILEDLGSAAGLHDVTGLSDYPRSVVNLEHIGDAPSGEDVRTFVWSA